MKQSLFERMMDTTPLDSKLSQEESEEFKSASNFSTGQKNSEESGITRVTTPKFSIKVSIKGKNEANSQCNRNQCEDSLEESKAKPGDESRRGKLQLKRME